MTLIADGNIKTYSTDFTTPKNGDINLVAGKGIYLYAKPEVYQQQTEKTKTSKLFGILKVGKKKTNKLDQLLTEKPAILIGGELDAQSGYSQTYEGTDVQLESAPKLTVGVGKYAQVLKELKLTARQQWQGYTTRTDNNRYHRNTAKAIVYTDLYPTKRQN